MNIITEEQIEQVVDSICSEIPDYHYALWYFGEALRNNELNDLFTEDQMALLDECSLTYQKENDEEEEESEDSGDSGADTEGKLITYDIQKSYPWSSGSWYEDENLLNESLKKEVTYVIKNILSL